METARPFPAGNILTAPPRAFPLSERERAFFEAPSSARAFPFRASAYLFSLIDPRDPDDPIRRQIVPGVEELTVRDYEKDDPLAEGEFTVAPGLVRRYPDRCILKVAAECAVHCRFCFRKGLLGAGAGAVGPDGALPAARYLERHPEIREVLLTGGDPLVLPPSRLEAVMAVLRARRPDISLRIGTRLPVADPERVTDGLAALLASFQPLWLTVHCNHPAELTASAAAALGRLVGRGLSLGAQSVLLAGVNDSAAVLGSLFRKQAEAGLRPYYLFHLDPAPGTSHFRVPLRRGLALWREVCEGARGRDLPVYALDLPQGGGKAPVESLLLEDEGPHTLRLRTPAGKTYPYPSD